MHLLDDHLSNALSAQGLAALECLTLEASKRVEDGGEREEDGAYDQACCLRPNADPLYSAQHGVERSAHIVCLNLAHETIELRGRWADAKEQRDFDEYNEEGRHSVGLVSWSALCEAQRHSLDVQANDAERNDKCRVEDVRDSERKAEDDAQHSSPGRMSALCVRDVSPRSLIVVPADCCCATRHRCF